MDNFVIKPENVGDKAAPSPTGRGSATALAGLAATFRELLHKTGMRLESGVHDIADRAGITALNDRVERAQPAEDYGRRPSSDERDRFDDRPRADHAGDRKAADRRIDKDNDARRDHGVEHRDGRYDAAGTDHGKEHADDHAGDKGDARAAGDEAPEVKDKSGEGTADTDAGDGVKAAGDETGATKEAAPSDGSEAVAAQAGVSGEATTQVLTGMVAGDGGLAADGRVSDESKTGAADGLLTAVANVNSAKTEHISETGTEAMSATAKENLSKATPVATGKSDGRETQHSSQGAVNANAQAKAVAAQPSAVKADGGDSTPQTAVESQASSLAQAMGGGNRAQVSVTVTNESETLVSKPGAALSANTVLSGEGSSQSTGGRSANTHTQGGGSQAQAAQAAAQQAQAAATQSQNAQNAALQASAQSGTDAKGLVQTQAASGNAGGTVHAGGVESGGQPGTGGVTGSQQSQQTQAQSEANQTGNAHKPARPGHSVVEQITVKITKAIQAGNDKITIQLRPANMGRVEVKMELSQDNRLVALVTVDSRDTLELLQKDSRELQRALQDAGLHTDAGDLNFNLRGQDGRDGGEGTPTGASAIEEELADLGDVLAGEPAPESDGGIYVNGRIDVRA